ncbi:hypothetical protein OS175_05460 [Marinicella sp. S1101]|uniref:hypothetical protein n=1 Tax=Marinicella marina TaxID=2996016 RepID=UPI002260885D|nr:hypothetical protein [Marinicella marina]MCX7553317.1 hypothetical protein [Marinicella marina]MDJ1139049.1 hypothetical protein [Marinicella marina]
MTTEPIVKNQGFNERQIKRIFWRRMAIVLWVSFFTAAVESMVFFALFDPAYLGQLSSFGVDVSQWQGYALGFMFFWVFTFSAALFSGLVLALPRTKLAKRNPNA